LTVWDIMTSGQSCDMIGYVWSRGSECFLDKQMTAHGLYIGLRDCPSIRWHSFNPQEQTTFSPEFIVT